MIGHLNSFLSKKNLIAAIGGHRCLIRHVLQIRLELKIPAARRPWQAIAACPELVEAEDR